MIAFYAKAEVEQDPATKEYLMAGKSILSLETNTQAVACLKAFSQFWQTQVYRQRIDLK